MRPYKPAGIPGLMPYLTIVDSEKAIKFYQEAFGFRVDGEPMAKDGKIMHAEMTYLDTRIMFSDQGTWDGLSKAPAVDERPCPINLYVYTEDVDKFFENAVKNGAKSVMPPTDMFWGDRMCRLADLDGYEWSFAQNIGEFDPSKIPS